MTQADKQVQKCAGRIWRNYGYGYCLSKGKIERSGKYYCGLHDPERVTERRAKRRAIRDARYKRRYEAVDERYR
ncbi:hypothetical protein LCGC14_1106050, partial [marine sediment metagenome]